LGNLSLTARRLVSWIGALSVTAATARARTRDGARANLYLVVRRAASAHHLSFPYAGKDFVFLVAVYSQTLRSGERLPNPGPPAAGHPFPKGAGISRARLQLKTGGDLNNSRE
jgi:hypothetical protein